MTFAGKQIFSEIENAQIKCKQFHKVPPPALSIDIIDILTFLNYFKLYLFIVTFLAGGVAWIYTFTKPTIYVSSIRIDSMNLIDMMSPDLMTQRYDALFKKEDLLSELSHNLAPENNFPAVDISRSFHFTFDSTDTAAVLEYRYPFKIGITQLRNSISILNQYITRYNKNLLETNSTSDANKILYELRRTKMNQIVKMRLQAINMQKESNLASDIHFTKILKLLDQGQWNGTTALAYLLSKNTLNNKSYNNYVDSLLKDQMIIENLDYRIDQILSKKREILPLFPLSHSNIIFTNQAQRKKTLETIIASAFLGFIAASISCASIALLRQRRPQ